MKKIVFIGILAALFTGCTVNKQPEPKDEVKQETTVEKEDVAAEQEEKEEAEKIANTPFTFYKIVPDKIEVFPYKRLYNVTVIDDKKLNDSFYVKGNYIRIEKIYSSEIGDKYGKIVGKNLLVSMDDLTKSDKK